MPKEPEIYPDITRPGDPDFTSFPKRLPDDCVGYTIHVLSNPLVSAPAQRSQLLEIQRAATKLCRSLLAGYIWQREDFSLELVNNVVGAAGVDVSGTAEEGEVDTAETGSPIGGGGSVKQSSRAWRLEGKTSFGDSIADEWLIVYLLRELSKQFKDAWIRVVDSDGEFLLVEAANVLPKWLNPEIAERRVWINDGKLRIIPRELSVTGSKGKSMNGTKASRSIPRELGLKDALDIIEQHRDVMIHSPFIEEEAFYRIRNYPNAIAESMHTANLSIPRKLAFILNKTPSNISAAVEAFYLRDPISLKPLQAKTAGRLAFSPEDFVTVSVKFTRVGYAQLKSQDFAPPTAWIAALRNVERTNEWNRRDMGMKVASGFEMLLADPQHKRTRAVREIRLFLDDIEEGEEELPTDAEIRTWPQKEDDEKWLDVNFEDFEKELNGKKGGKPAAADGDGVTDGFGDKTAQENLRKMVERFEQFLNDDDAGMDGAEFSDEMDYDDDDDDNDDDDDGEDRDASFDEEEFANMMKQMMGMAADDETPQTGRVDELDSDAESDEEDMVKTMKRMEDELREAGALGQDQNVTEDDNGDPRYNLAKNFLESFKGQAGTAGPAGNLLSSMGLKLPRHDEGA